ncbi:MAG: YfhO family protein [Deltaproteobacteria bacterium]|nr:YfhO family protein [Deltaproteobacteria bacterium]
MKDKYKLLLACSFFALTFIIVFSHSIFTNKIILISNVHDFNPFFSVKGVPSFPAEPFDTVNQFLPWFHFDRESLRNFSLPLWNPDNGCGAPHIANIQSAFFYPLNMFVYLFDWKWGLLLLYFFKFFLVSLFAYLYLSEIGVDYRAALVASMACMYSGYMYMFQFQDTGAAFCFFLGLWAIEFVIKHPDRFMGYVLLMTAFVTAVFAGQPEILFFMTFVLAVYFLIRVFTEYGFDKQGYLIIGKACLFIFIGILISAIQLLPFIEYLHTNTVFSYRTSIKGISFYPLSSFLAAISDFFGMNIITINASSFHWMHTRVVNYIGMVFFLFGLAGIVNLFRERIIKTYTALFIVTMIIPFNIPLIHNIFADILGFDVARKSYLLIFSGYFLIFIGAKYLGAFLNGKYKPKTINIAVYLTVFIILVLFLMSGRYYRLNIAPVCIAIFVGIAVLFTMKIKNKNVVAVLLGIMVFLFQAVLLIVVLSPPLNPDYFFPTNAIINKIKGDNPPFRVFPVMKSGIKAYDPDLNTFYNIEDLRNYDTMGVRWYDKFVLNLLTEPRITNFLNVKYIILPRHTAINAAVSASQVQTLEPAIVSYNNISLYINRYSFDIDMPVNKFQPVLSANGFTLYKNPDTLRRAFMVYNYKIADTHNKAFDLVSWYASQLSETAVIFKEDARYASFMPVNTVTTSSSSVSFEKYSPNHIKLHVVTTLPGLLVISNTYFPGWHVRIDGRKSKVIRTDYAFQGVFVPEGIHWIELDYMPLSFVIGFVISIIGILAVLLLYIVYLKSHDDKSAINAYPSAVKVSHPEYNDMPLKNKKKT